jgi:hypothetical protein
VNYGAAAVPGEVGQADPFLSRFQEYRIASYTRFGNASGYVFLDAMGSRVTQKQLLQEGFRVIGRGSREVTIMEPGQRYITVTEYVALPPVIADNSQELEASPQAFQRNSSP